MIGIRNIAQAAAPQFGLSILMLCALFAQALQGTLPGSQHVCFAAHDIIECVGEAQRTCGWTGDMNVSCIQRVPASKPALIGVLDSRGEVLPAFGALTGFTFRSAISITHFRLSDCNSLSHRRSDCASSNFVVLRL